MRLLAYIDLPSGSAIFQFLIAGLLGVSVAFRSFWRWIWDALTGRGRRGASADEPKPGESADPTDRGAGKG
jgi:hypothetical protein